MLTSFTLLSAIFHTTALAARRWNNTGVGTIIFEEAWTPTALGVPVSNTAPPVGQSANELNANLLDVHNQRLARMDANGVDFMILSCTSPCIQGIADPVEAASMARQVNDELADTISNNTLRFGGFAALAMQNATEAAQELKRAVQDLGFFGALVNDYQETNADGNTTLLFYDTPEFDPFWQMVTDLDVPVYFHPRANIPTIANLEFSHSRFLLGPSQEFAVTLSTHIMGLCTNGVFDRFPKLNILVGHMGERVPSDFWRIDDQLARQVPQGMPMQRNLSSYWRTNLLETTSGNFGTDLLKFHISQIGLDRILYSVDYPFVAIEQGAAFINGLPETTGLSAEEIVALKRGRAIELLKLDQ
ncbi:hypothetical protein EYR40_002640 [Pleurotus pulmonarius]|nr:hypothetical protein EYR40_002640 [Pleurotus pulmonarius]